LLVAEAAFESTVIEEGVVDSVRLFGGNELGLLLFTTPSSITVLSNAASATSNWM
jgi:hypothetical protein